MNNNVRARNRYSSPDTSQFVRAFLKTLERRSLFSPKTLGEPQWDITMTTRSQTVGYALERQLARALSVS